MFAVVLMLQSLGSTITRRRLASAAALTLAYGDYLYWRVTVRPGQLLSSSPGGLFPLLRYYHCSVWGGGGLSSTATSTSQHETTFKEKEAPPGANSER